MVTYELMNKDNIVLEFIKTDTLEGQFKILKECKNETRPYLLSKNSNELDTWLNNRAIPSNREHIDRVLLSLNLDSKERENKDRHFSNFGFLVNNDAGKIKKLAPIF